MVQFYFLSILLTVLTGLTLIFTGDTADGTDAEASSSASLFANTTFRLVLGILTFVIGVLKLFPAIQMNRVFLFGDLLPVAAGLMGGFTLLLGYYLESTSVEVTLPKTIDLLFVHSKKYIGVACVVIGVVHYIFPAAPLL